MSNEKRGPGAPSTITDEQKKEVVDLYSMRIPVAEIVVRTGISTATIYKIIRERKVPMTRRGSHDRHICISIDDETGRILDIMEPANTSTFFCNLVRKEYGFVLAADERRKDKEEGDK